MHVFLILYVNYHCCIYLQNYTFLRYIVYFQLCTVFNYTKLEILIYIYIWLTPNYCVIFTYKNRNCKSLNFCIIFTYKNRNSRYICCTLNFGNVTYSYTSLQGNKYNSHSQTTYKVINITVTVKLHTR